MSSISKKLEIISDIDLILIISWHLDILKFIQDYLETNLDELGVKTIYSNIIQKTQKNYLYEFPEITKNFYENKVKFFTELIIKEFKQTNVLYELNRLLSLQLISKKLLIKCFLEKLEDRQKMEVEKTVNKLLSKVMLEEK